jgi:hypothetical protein
VPLLQGTVPRHPQISSPEPTQRTDIMGPYSAPHMRIMLSLIDFQESSSFIFVIFLGTFYGSSRIVYFDLCFVMSQRTSTASLCVDKRGVRIP